MSQNHPLLQPAPPPGSSGMTSISGLKYRLLWDTDGKPLDWDIDATFQRVAHAIAEVEPQLAAQAPLERGVFVGTAPGAIPCGASFSVQRGRGAPARPTPTINWPASATLRFCMESILSKTPRRPDLKVGCGIAESSPPSALAGALAGAGPVLPAPVVHGHLRQDLLTVSSAGGGAGPRWRL